MMETLSFIVFLLILTGTQSQTICVWNAVGWVGSINGEYEYQGLHNNKPYYKQKECDKRSANVYLYSWNENDKYYFNTELGVNPYPSHKGNCAVSGIQSPTECTQWEWPSELDALKITDGKCPDILANDASYTGIEIADYDASLNGIYDIKLGRNMFRSSTSTTPKYLLFDPYSFKWRFITLYTEGDDAWKGTSDPDMSCPASSDTYNHQINGWAESANDLRTVFQAFNGYPSTYSVPMLDGGSMTLKVRNKASTPLPTSSPTPMPTYSVIGTAIEISAADKQYLIEQHNYYRGQVAKGLINGYDSKPLPKASKMYAATWDDSIAASTQNWANHCDGGHSNLQGYWAENIIWGWNNRAPLEDATRSWVSEHERYIYGQVGAPNGVVGHFTNVIRETNTKFGCGLARCPNFEPSSPPYWFVCGYSDDGKHKMSDDVTGPYTTSDVTGSGCTQFNSNAGICYD